MMVPNEDDFYDYSKFSDEKLTKLFESWDGLGGLHGLMLKECAKLLMGKTVLDVGCGACHLFELLKGKISRYVGLDVDWRAIDFAKKRYPELNRTKLGVLGRGSVYDLDRMAIARCGRQFRLKKYDTVFAIGLYNHEPTKGWGITEMLERANQCIVITFRPANWNVLRVAYTLKLPIEYQWLNDIAIVRIKKITKQNDRRIISTRAEVEEFFGNSVPCEPTTLSDKNIEGMAEVGKKLFNHQKLVLGEKDK